MQAPVTVLDRDGHVVNGLNALDFTLYDNGKEQQITEDLTSHPISLVVAVQANHRVEKIPAQDPQDRQPVRQPGLGEDGEIAVIAFDHRMQTLHQLHFGPR